MIADTNRLHFLLSVVVLAFTLLLLLTRGGDKPGPLNYHWSHPAASLPVGAAFSSLSPAERADAAMLAASFQFGRELRRGSGPLCATPFAASASLANLEFLESRHNLPPWLEHMGFTGDGAELGVRQGEFAAHTLREWPSVRHYFLVDPWVQQAVYRDDANVANAEQDARMRETIQAVAKFAPKPVILRNYSFDAVKSFDDCALDYVYVDAVHDYDGALNDMIDWWPKVRPGGVMAGHDYGRREDSGDGFTPHGIFGVTEAVRRFCEAVNVQYFLTGEGSSFYFIKPRYEGAKKESGGVGRV